MFQAYQTSPHLLYRVKTTHKICDFHQNPPPPPLLSANRSKTYALLSTLAIRYSRQRRIIFLSMLTPPLRGDVLIRGDGPTFPLGAHFENHGRYHGDASVAYDRVAFPCHRRWPPASRGGPDLFFFARGEKFVRECIREKGDIG
jgi:hypothetical protein